MPPLDIEPVEGNPFAPAAQPFLDAAQAMQRPYIEITPHDPPQTAQVPPDVLVSGFAGGIAPVRSAPQAAQPFLDMAAIMGQRAVDLAPLEPGYRAPRLAEPPASPEFYRTTGVSPLPAMRQNLAGVVQQMHERNRSPDPSELMWNLGGGPGAGPSMAMAAGPAVKKLAQQGEAEIAKGIDKFIRAYHGSPYDFERFDLSKIGTGEGAQAYGHGLYFAEEPQTARSYREALTRTSGNAVLDWSERNPELAQQARQQLEAHSRSLGISPPDNNLFALMLTSTKEGHPPDAFTPELAKQIQSTWEKPAGKMYEVSIAADPDHFLHWDKPLSEQPQIARKIKDLISSPNNPFTGETTNKLQEAMQPFEMKNTTGDTIMRIAGHDAYGAQALRDAGIPGIKYLDQGSRGNVITAEDISQRLRTIDADIEYATKMGDTDALKNLKWEREQWEQKKPTLAQTHNYVVFDDKLINIVRKFGMAGVALVGAGYELVPVAENRDPFAP